MKNFLAAFLFLVSWQEQELKPHYNRDPNEGTYIDTTTGLGFSDAVYRPPAKILYYIIETVDKSVKLKTQADVDKFVPRHNVGGHYERTVEDALNGLIGPNAFNISVKELPE